MVHLGRSVVGAMTDQTLSVVCPPDGQGGQRHDSTRDHQTGGLDTLTGHEGLRLERVTVVMVFFAFSFNAAIPHLGTLRPKSGT